VATVGVGIDVVDVPLRNSSRTPTRIVERLFTR